MSEEFHVDDELENQTNTETIETGENIDILDQPESPVDAEAEQRELEELARLNREIKEEEEAEEEELRRAYEQHLTNVKDNFSTFINWITDAKIDSNLYKNYSEYFDDQFRSDLFVNICEFFKDENYVTDDVLFYWKCLTISLMRNSRKYKSSLDELIFDLEEKSTNLRLVPQKCLFRCFIEDEPICYLKENGNSYYVS